MTDLPDPLHSYSTTRDMPSHPSPAHNDSPHQPGPKRQAKPFLSVPPDKIRWFPKPKLECFETEKSFGLEAKSKMDLDPKRKMDSETKSFPALRPRLAPPDVRARQVLPGPLARAGSENRSRNRNSGIPWFGRSRLGSYVLRVLYPDGTPSRPESQAISQGS